MDAFLNTVRHETVFSADLFGQRWVDIYGVDAVSSRFVVDLAKLGVGRIRVCDERTVTPELIAAGAFGLKHEGQPRVEALQRIVMKLTGTDIVACRERPEEAAHEPGEVVLLSPDGLEARRALWEGLEYNLVTDLVIDPRMDAGSRRIYSLNPNNADQAEAFGASLEHETALLAPSAPAAMTTAGAALWQFIRWFSLESGSNKAGDDSLEFEVPLELLGFEPDIGSKLADLDICVVGSGAVGSRVVLGLSQLGARKIRVWDFDKVESHNIPNQAFGLGHVGKYKVDAVKDMAKKRYGAEIEVCRDRVDEATRGMGQIVFLVPDSMKARKGIFEGALLDNGVTENLFEGRMDVSEGRVYAIDLRNPAHIEQYGGTMYEDSKAAVSPCGSTISVGPTAVSISGYLLWQFLRTFDDSAEAPEQELLVSLRPQAVQTDRF